MGDAGLLASLVGMNHIVHRDNVGELVSRRHTGGLDTSHCKIHLEHRLNGIHATLGLILNAHGIGSRPRGRTRIQTRHDRRSHVHDRSGGGRRYALLPGVLAGVVVEKLHQLRLCCCRCPKPNAINLTAKFGRSLLSKGCLGDNLLLLRRVLATRKRPLGRVLVSGGCSAFVTTRCTHSSLFPQNINDIPIHNSDITTVCTLKHTVC